jgi:hypothetical protein
MTTIKMLLLLAHLMAVTALFDSLTNATRVEDPTTAERPSGSINGVYFVNWWVILVIGTKKLIQI